MKKMTREATKFRKTLQFDKPCYNKINQCLAFLQQKGNKAMNQIPVKKLKDNAILPTYGSAGAAGADLYACLEAPVEIAPGRTAFIPTGIAIGLDDPHYAAFIYARSGLAIKHGIGLLNSVGVIDSDYRGEICVGVIKQTDPEYTIEPYERIAQMVIEPVELPEIVEVDSLDDTDRGAGGFGSTGTK